MVVVAAEIVTAAVLAVNVAVLLEVVPTVTLPKLRLLGEIVRVPEVVVWPGVVALRVLEYALKLPAASVARTL